MSSTMDSSEFILTGNFRTVGIATPDDCTNVGAGADQNVDTEKHPLGSVFTGYQKSATGIVGGAYSLIYLKTGTELSGTAIAVKRMVCMEADPASNTSGDLLYTVTNDPGTAIMTTGLCAFAMSAMTTGGYYGWFWFDGVCPETVCSGMAGTYETDGNVVVGGFVAVTDTEINPGTDPANSAIMRVGICLTATDV